MGRIQNYKIDDEVTGQDKLVGTDYNGNFTRNYTIDEIINLVDNRETSTSLDTRYFKMILDDFDFTNIPTNYDNAVWFIRYQHDLSSETINLPKNVTLMFAGGIIYNGTIVGDNTKIESDTTKIFETSTILSGSWGIKEMSPDWFGAIGDGSIDDYNSIAKAISESVNISCRNIKLSAGKNYLVGTSVVLNYSNFIFDLNNATITTLGDIAAINLGAILSSGNSFTKISIKNGVIQGSGEGNLNNRAIVARNISLAVVSNMKFSNFGAKPLLLSSDTRGMQYNQFENIEIVDNFNGAIKLEVGSIGSYINDNSFFNVRCHDTPRTGGGSVVILDIQGKTTEEIQGNRFLSCAFETRDASHTLVNLSNTNQNSFITCRLDGLGASRALEISADSNANFFWLQGTDGTLNDLSETSLYMNKKDSGNFPYIDLGEFRMALEQPSGEKELHISALNSGKIVRFPEGTKTMLGNRDSADDAPFIFHMDESSPFLEILTQVNKDSNRPYIRIRDQVNDKNFFIRQTSNGLIIESDGGVEPIIIQNEGIVELPANSYSRPLKIGSSYYWNDIDKGTLRTKSTTPTFDTDGLAVGINKRGVSNFPFISYNNFTVGIQQPSSSEELTIESSVSGGRVRIPSTTQFMIGDRGTADNAPFGYYSDSATPYLEILTQTGKDSNRPYIRWRDSINDKNINVTKTSTGLEFETSTTNNIPLKINDDDSIDMDENAWNTPLKLGSNYIWVDTSGVLRIKNLTPPSSDSDGVVVGTQT